MRHVAYALVGAVIGFVAIGMLAGAIHAHRTAARGGDIEGARRTIVRRLNPITAVGAIAGAIAGVNLAAWQERR